MKTDRTEGWFEVPARRPHDVKGWVRDVAGGLIALALAAGAIILVIGAYSTHGQCHINALPFC